MGHKIKHIQKRLFLGGYFPKELPCNFEVSNVDNLIDQTPVEFNHEKDQISVAISHNITRFNNFTRKLGVPNPVTYYRLVEEITTHLSKVVNPKNKSPYCFSFPVEGAEEFTRAYIWEYDWQLWKEIKIKKQTGFKYSFKTDISNFYPSIYTHVIPWVTEGKSVAKKNKTNRSLLGNKLDLKVRNCQDGQTQGLQIGPDTSFLLSELILNHIDALILKELKLKKIEHQGVRFVDDYEFYFNSDDHAKLAQQIVTRILSEYELSSNPIKTEIIELPTEFEKEWVVDIRNRQVHSGSAKTKRQLVIDYFNFVLSLQKSHSNEQVLAYALARIEDSSILLEDKELFFSLLLNLITYDSSVVKWTVNFINLDTKVIVNSDVRKLFEHAIPKFLKDFSDRGRHNDVLWCLILTYFFNIKITAKLSESIYKEGNSLVKLMCLDLVRLKYMKLKINLTPESEDFWGEDWILYYTVFTQDEFNEFRGRSKMSTNPFFRALVNSSISFYSPFLDGPTDDEFDDYISKLCEKVRDSEYKVEIDGERYDASRRDIQTCSRCGDNFISEELGVCSNCWEYMISKD